MTFVRPNRRTILDRVLVIGLLDPMNSNLIGPKSMGLTSVEKLLARFWWVPDWFDVDARPSPD